VAWTVRDRRCELGRHPCGHRVEGASRRTADRTHPQHLVLRLDPKTVVTVAGHGTKAYSSTVRLTVNSACKIADSADTPASRRRDDGSWDRLSWICPIVTAMGVQVYAWCMTRTNVDVDDDLVAAAMRRFGVRTKRAAIDLALRQAAGPPLTTEMILDVRGIGWDGDLDELRSARDLG